MWRRYSGCSYSCFTVLIPHDEVLTSLKFGSSISHMYLICEAYHFLWRHEKSKIRISPNSHDSSNSNSMFDNKQRKNWVIFWNWNMDLLISSLTYYNIKCRHSLVLELTTLVLHTPTEQNLFILQPTISLNYFSVMFTSSEIITSFCNFNRNLRTDGLLSLKLRSAVGC